MTFLKILLLSLVSFFYLNAFAGQKLLTRDDQKALYPLLVSNWKKAKSWIDDLTESRSVSYIKVRTLKGQKQSLELKVSGVNPKSCAISLAKISRYQDYQNYLSFIEKSFYKEKSQKAFFLISHSLLPYKMSLSLRIPRIKKPGHYPFEFISGIFPYLKGKIFVARLNNKCFFFIDAHWEGSKTGINSTLLEVFLQTISEIGMNRLMRF